VVDEDEEENRKLSSKSASPKNVSVPEHVSIPEYVSIPEPLESFTNTLEICTWLVEHPYILNLANRMLDAKTLSPVSSNVFINNDTSAAGGCFRNDTDTFTRSSSSSIVVENVRII